MDSSASDISNVFNYLYTNGYTTSSGGNISVRLGNGNFLISPSSKDKGNLRPEDIIETDSQGNYSAVDAKPSMEYPFHLAVYKNRPDISALIHVHSPALVAFSIMGKTPDMSYFPLIWHLTGDIGFVPYECPGTTELANAVAAEMSKGYKAVILQNHGVLVGGPDIRKAVSLFEIIEHVASILLLSGKNLPLKPGKPDYSKSVSENINTDNYKIITAFTNEITDLQYYFRRIFSRKLCPAGLLSLSLRMDDKSFLYVDDLDGKFYSGTDPCVKSVSLDIPDRGNRYPMQLHSMIYNKNPGINVIISAYPPYSTMRGLCGKLTNTSLMPESFLILNNVKYTDIEELMLLINKRNSEYIENSNMLVIRGDCIISGGKGFFEAFYRLEVLELTARTETMAEVAGCATGLNDVHLKFLSGFFQ